MSMRGDVALTVAPYSITHTLREKYETYTYSLSSLRSVRGEVGM